MKEIDYNPNRWSSSSQTVFSKVSSANHYTLKLLPFGGYKALRVRGQLIVKKKPRLGVDSSSLTEHSLSGLDLGETFSSAILCQ
jgi:hypothetical protein